MGSLSIEMLSEKQLEDYTLREIKVSDVTVSQIINLLPFVSGWPNGLHVYVIIVYVYIAVILLISISKHIWIILMSYRLLMLSHIL